MGLTPPEKAQTYLREAEAIRARARDMQDPEARTQLLWIATLYDKLAAHLVRLTDSDSPQPEEPTD
jgi:hypothetical protein